MDFGQNFEWRDEDVSGDGNPALRNGDVERRDGGVERWDRAGVMRRARRLADLSQREMATAAGVSASTVARSEMAEHEVSLAAVESLLAAAGLRLIAVDESGREVLPMRPDAVRDRAGRRYPAHLDTVLPDDFTPAGHQWRPEQPPPPVTFGQRTSRDRARRDDADRRTDVDRHDDPDHRDDADRRADVDQDDVGRDRAGHGRTSWARDRPRPSDHFTAGELAQAHRERLQTRRALLAARVRPEPEEAWPDCHCGPECERDCAPGCECGCEPPGLARAG